MAGCNNHMLLSIVDPTVDKEHKLKCSLFTRELEYLPHVTEIGQIIRMHRLKIGEFRGELQGQSRPGFSALVFDKEVGGSLTPHTGHHMDAVTITDDDLKRVEELREWEAHVDDDILSQAASLDYTAPSAAQRPKTSLSRMNLGQYADVVCQVVGKCVLAPDEAILLKVWDGTKVTSPVFEEPLDDIQMQQMEVNVGLFQRARGYMVDVKVFDDHFPAAEKVKTGDFILLSNLHAARYRDPATGPTSQIEFCLHQGTSYGRRLCILHPIESRDVHALKLILEEAANDQDESQSSLDDSILRAIEMPTPEKTVKDSTRIQTRSSAKKLTDSTRKESTPGRVLNGIDNGAVRNLQSDFGVDGGASTSTAGQTGGKGKRKSGETGEGKGKKLRLNHGLDSVEDRCLYTTATVIVDHHHIEKTTISDVQNGDVPHKYRIRCTITNYQPKPKVATDLVKLYCQHCHFLSKVPGSINRGTTVQANDSEWWDDCEPCRVERGIKYFYCPKCKQEDSQGSPVLEYTYMLQLILDDSSGWILAQLWRQHAMTFFNDLPPEEILRKVAKFKRIQFCLEDLCPASQESQRPTVECCIQSYNTQHGTCYQIFDTQYALIDSAH